MNSGCDAENDRHVNDQKKNGVERPVVKYVAVLLALALAETFGSHSARPGGTPPLS